jgi:hypothetical protein
MIDSWIHIGLYVAVFIVALKALCKTGEWIIDKLF